MQVNIIYTRVTITIFLDVWWSLSKKTLQLYIRKTIILSEHNNQ